MSLIWTNGFESDTNKYSRWNDQYEKSEWGTWRSMDQVAGAKRTGNYGMRLFRSNYTYGSSWGGSYSCKRFYSDFTTNTGILGFSIKQDYFHYSYGTFAYIGNASSGTVLQLQLNSENKLQAVLVPGGVVGTGNYSLGANTQYYIQMKLKIDGTNSEVIVKLGSQIDISTSSLTINTTNRSDQIIIFQSGSVATGQQSWVPHTNVDFDDIYVVIDDGVAPTDFLGICGIYGALPSAVGDRNDFENYGGTNPVTLVSEGSTDTGTYVYGDGLNEKVLFEFSDITTLPGGTIKGIFIYDYAARSASGEGASKYRLVFRDTTDAEYEAADTTLADANQYQHLQKYVKNPITDTTWDITSLNTMQFGIKVTQVD